MRRIVLLLAVITAVLLPSGGVALAATVSSNPDDAPQTDGVVFSVLPVGDRIYIGGDFTHMDGVPRNRLAAIDATTGAGDAGFNAGKVDKAARAIAVSGNRLYVGGDFSTVKGQSRTRLALVDATTGALDANWTPSADNMVTSLVLSPDGTRLYAGGRFTSVSGQSRLRLAALDSANTGAPLPWRPLLNPNGPIIDLAVSGARVFAAAGGAAGAAESYDADSGARVWQLKGDGNFQAITVTGGKAYMGGHFLKIAGQDRRFFAAADAATGVLDPGWAPSGSGAKLSEVPSTGVWDFASDEVRGRLYAGTNFGTVNGQPHAGFVRFSASP